MINWLAGEQAVVVVFWVWMTIFTIAAPRLIRNLKGIKSTPYYLQIFPAIVYCTVGVAWLFWGMPVVIFAWVTSAMIATRPAWKKQLLLSNHATRKWRFSFSKQASLPASLSLCTASTSGCHDEAANPFPSNVQGRSRVALDILFFCLQKFF